MTENITSLTLDVAELVIRMIETAQNTARPDDKTVPELMNELPEEVREAYLLCAHTALNYVFEVMEESGVKIQQYGGNLQ